MRHFRLTSLLSATTAAALTAGCTVGPDYQTPSVTTPAAWESTPPGVNADGTADLTRWWTAFDDPVLDRLMEDAVAGNHDLRIAGQRVLEARADRAIAAASGEPSLSASATAERARQSKAMPFIPLGGIANSFQAGFDASWEIDLFGKNRRAVEAADASLEAAEWDRRGVLVSLLGELGTDYAALRTAQARIAIAQRTIAADRDELDLARQKFDHGLGSELDVAQADAELQQVSAQQPQLETAVAQNAHAIAVLLGKPPEALTDELSLPGRALPAPPALPALLPSEVVRNRPDLRRAERTAAAANAEVGVAIAAKFPSFNLASTLGGDAGRLNRLLTGPGVAWSLAGSLAQPIYAGGALDAAVEKARAESEALRIAYEQSVFQAFAEVEDALASLSNERRRFDSLQRAVSANRTALDRANALYRGGLTPFLNVVTSERNLFAAEDALAQSDLTLTQQTVALYKALGGGWQVAANAQPETPAPRP
jgi:NodT family efflux transporter outer membrane factor (OMF) lipoprotein